MQEHSLKFLALLHSPSKYFLSTSCWNVFFGPFLLFDTQLSTQMWEKFNYFLEENPILSFFLEENPIFVIFFGVAMSHFPIFLTCPIT